MSTDSSTHLIHLGMVQSFLVFCALLVIVLRFLQNKKIQKNLKTSEQLTEITQSWECPPELIDFSPPRRVELTGWGWFGLLGGPLIMFLIFALMVQIGRKDIGLRLQLVYLLLPLLFFAAASLSRLRKMNILKTGVPAPGVIIMDPVTTKNGVSVYFQFIDSAGQVVTTFCLVDRVTEFVKDSSVHVLYLQQNPKRAMIYPSRDFRIVQKGRFTV